MLQIINVRCGEPHSVRQFSVCFIGPYIRIHDLRGKAVAASRKIRMLKRREIFVRKGTICSPIQWFTIASVACSWTGLNGWSTNSSLDCGLSNELISTHDGIEVTLVISCGVFGALLWSLVLSFNEENQLEVLTTEWMVCYTNRFGMFSQKFHPRICAITGRTTLIGIDLQKETFVFTESWL